MRVPPLSIDEDMMVDKKVIKFAPRVKDVDRQYEMNNNCELDNGVYNKFVKQSTENAADSEGGGSLASSINKSPCHLVSKNSDEDAEEELMNRRKKQEEEAKSSELRHIQSFVQMQMTGPTEISDDAIEIGKQWFDDDGVR